MFCEYCGNDLPENAKFCNKCGKPVKQVQPAAQAQTKMPVTQAPAEKAKPKKTRKEKAPKEKKKSGKLLIVLVVVLILVLGASVGLAALLLSDDSGGFFSVFHQEEEADEEKEDGNEDEEEDRKEKVEATETEETSATETEAASIPVTETVPEAEQTTETAITGEKVAWGRNADYILPDSSTRELTDEDLEEIRDDAEKLRLARNEIYARHGRLFTDEELQAYFDAKDWYTGTIAAEDFTDDMLSDIERDNLIIIKDYESKLEERE